MANTPRFTYDGLNPNYVQRVSVTVSHGITPAVITVQIPAGAQLPNLEGTAVLSFGGTSITFPGCKFDIGQSTLQGGGSWTLSILDGRWRWQYGTISGHFNLRDVEGKLRTSTEQTPQQLAQMCLREMRITTYDLSQMPDQPRPECHWSHRVPAQALMELADAVGCRVVVTPRGLVRICPAGEGADLPDVPSMDIGLAVDTGALPSAVLVVGGEALFQARWTLVAVGRDTDGEIKPIDDLSYRPSTGWENSFPGHFTDVAEGTDDTQPDPRKLALQTVWRWYRIDELVDGQQLPGIPRTSIESWKECLPLQDGLLDTYKDGFSKNLQRQPPIVRGDFFDGEFTYEEVTDGQYRGGLSVMAEAGVIVMDKPLYRYDDTGKIVPADIQVEIAFPWKQNDKEEPYRPTWRYTVKPRPDVGDHALFREEIKFTARWLYDSQGNRTGQRDNRQADNLDDQAEYAARGFVTSLGNVNSADRTYPGLLDLQLDGAIQQVTWEFGTSQGPSTHASRCSEHDTDIIPSYADRKRVADHRQLMQDIKRMGTGKQRNK